MISSKKRFKKATLYSGLGYSNLPHTLWQTTGKLKNSDAAIGTISDVKADYKTMETVNAKKMVAFTPTADDKLFTEKEIAIALNISIWTIRRWRLKEGLPYIGTGRRYFYRMPSIKEWMTRQEVVHGV